jgi:cytochrome P450
MPSSGLTRSARLDYFKLGVASLLFTTAPEVAFAGMVRLGDLLREDIASRRDGSYHRAGFLEDLLQTGVDGHLLSEEEIFPFVSVLLAAGAETSMRTTSNLLLALAHSSRPAGSGRTRPFPHVACRRGNASRSDP